MPELVYYVAVSLDGFIAPQDGGLSWLAEYEGTGEDHGYAEFYASCDALLMGGLTYDQVLTFGDWPFAGKPTWVWTRQPRLPQHADVRFFSGVVSSAWRELASTGVRRVWLVGGGELAGACRAGGLITEYILSAIPVILGAGRPLFGLAPASQSTSLSLISSQAYRSGIVQMRYLVREAAH